VNGDEHAELELISVTELARLWHVSRATIERRIHDGTIPAVWIGPTLRVPAAAARRIVNGDDR
jgi:excisionase family DNA binding protein